MANIYPRIPLISTFSRDNATISPKIYEGGTALLRREAKRVSRAVYSALKSWKRRNDEDEVKGGRGGGSAEGLKLLRGIGKIFELPRRSNYELCGTKRDVMAVRPCIRAHRNAFVAAMGIKRDAEFPRRPHQWTCANGWVDRWMDGWMDDTVKKISM